MTDLKYLIRFFIVLLIIETTILTTHANAVENETIIIPVGSQTSMTPVTKPPRGMSQASVEKNFGKPENIDGPKGQPPITRWDYNDVSIYFESDSVIHSVIKYKLNKDQ